METEQAEEHLLAVLAAARLGDETIRSEQFTNIAPKNLNLGELECGQTVFDGCQFTNCDFSGTAFYASSFRQSLSPTAGSETPTGRIASWQM